MHSTLAQNQFVVPELDDIPSVSTHSSSTTSSGSGSGSGRSFNRNTFNRYSRSTAVTATTTSATSATSATTTDSPVDQSAAVSGRTDYTAL